MIYYYIICNFVINTPIAAGPLFLYCFVLAVPGDIALSILGAVVAKRSDRCLLMRQCGQDLKDVAADMVHEIQIHGSALGLCAVSER